MTDKLTKLALFFAFFALSSVSICASEPIDSIASDTTTVLGEVYVSAPTIKTFANRMEIFMPERNRNYGTNALDAISSLPQFRKPIMGDQLTTPEGTPIFLLIDGKSASYNELMAVRPENIAKLVFYDPAPRPLFGSRGNGSARCRDPSAKGGFLFGLPQHPQFGHDT